MRRWAEVATASPDETRMTAELQQRVVPLIKQGSFGEARRWWRRCATCRFRSPRPSTLPSTSSRAGSSWSTGAATIARRLHDFLPRAEQTEAFKALLHEHDGWALHYVGFGGVGKTTLLREITARLADKEGVSTAGIDFDFLTADYPLTRPVELLSQFASELRLQDDSGLARSEFASFDDSVRVLNERLDRRSGFAASPAAALPSRGRGAGLTPAAEIAGDDALREIIETFALGLEALNRRVVLLLDTCEELARLRPDGTAPASVEVTFDILERLHARVPSVRVVFCGRRPLASKGTNWSAVGSRLAVVRTCACTRSAGSTATAPRRSSAPAPTPYARSFASPSSIGPAASTTRCASTTTRRTTVQ